MIQELEDKICVYFKIDKDKLIGKGHEKDASLARGMLWYILHYDMGVSSPMIAKNYDRGLRGVKHLIAKYKYIIENQRIYNEQYKAIKDM